MRVVGRVAILAAAAAGGLATSQFPEFSQQYRQRIGGALDEMRQVVADFDADAVRSGLSREMALDTYGRSAETFLRDRGITMGEAIRRFEWLSEQEARLESAPPLMRPIVVLSGPDERVLRGAWSDFEPALPVTPAGLIWAGIGLLLAAGLMSLVRQIFRIARAGRRRRSAASQT